jgi:hypothetical protein
MPAAFNYDPTAIVSIGCKLYNILTYAFDALSPWCLVYISAEKFISIAAPTKRHMFIKRKNQIIFFVCLCIFNFIYHINVPFSFDLLNIENSTICFFTNEENHIIIPIMDLVNCVLAPFLLMMTFSSLLIGAIFKSRRIIHLNDSEKKKKRLKRDIKFSISSLSMNLLFVILNMPIEIEIFFSYYDNNDLYVIFNYLYFFSYAVNFYIILFTNSQFRKEFFSLFFKNDQTRNDGTHFALSHLAHIRK